MTPTFPYRKILVATDFSPPSVTAMRHGFDLAAATGASVTLLNVVDTRFPYPDLFSFQDPSKDYFKAMRDRALAQMKQRMEDISAAADVEVETLVVRGKPKEEIAGTAAEVGADLIVIARQGSDRVSRALLGSVASATVEAAECPVVVVPAIDVDEDA